MISAFYDIQVIPQQKVFEDVLLKKVNLLMGFVKVKYSAKCKHSGCFTMGVSCYFYRNRMKCHHE